MADSPLAPAPGKADASPGAAGAGPSTPVGPTNALSSERYLAWLYSPVAQQPVLAALCQIEAEVAASLRQGVEHHVAHARLQWWREECERAAEGRAVHPLTRELVRAFGSRSAAAPAGSSTAVSGAADSVTSSSAASGSTTGRLAGALSAVAGISGFVDAAVWDLAGATFETRKELAAYCERWGTAMFATAAPGLGSQAAHATRVAHVAGQLATERGSVIGATTGANAASGALQIRALGAAVREVELLVGLAREAHAGRIRVPLDELERAGVEVPGLARAPWPAALVNLLRERHESLRETIAAGVARFGRNEQASIRGLLVWAALAWRMSQRAQRALPNVLRPRRYHALSDGWYAWRAAHRASAGRLRLNS